MTITHVEHLGDFLRAKYSDGASELAYPTSGSLWIAGGVAHPDGLPRFNRVFVSNLPFTMFGNIDWMHAQNDRIIVASYGGVYYSINGGFTWVLSKPSRATNGRIAGLGFYFWGAGFGSTVSFDNGSTHYTIVHADPLDSFQDVAYDGEFYYASVVNGSSNFIRRSSDGITFEEYAEAPIAGSLVFYDGDFILTNSGSGAGNEYVTSFDAETWSDPVSLEAIANKLVEIDGVLFSQPQTGFFDYEGIYHRKFENNSWSDFHNDKRIVDVGFRFINEASDLFWIIEHSLSMSTMGYQYAGSTISAGSRSDGYFPLPIYRANSDKYIIAKTSFDDQTYYVEQVLDDTDPTNNVMTLWRMEPVT